MLEPPSAFDAVRRQSIVADGMRSVISSPTPPGTGSATPHVSFRQAVTRSRLRAYQGNATVAATSTPSVHPTFVQKRPSPPPEGSGATGRSSQPANGSTTSKTAPNLLIIACCVANLEPRSTPEELAGEGRRHRNAGGTSPTGLAVDADAAMGREATDDRSPSDRLPLAKATA